MPKIIEKSISYELKASILSISGNSALEYLEDILINTKQLGLVN